MISMAYTVGSEREDLNLSHTTKTKNKLSIAEDVLQLMASKEYI